MVPYRKMCRIIAYKKHNDLAFLFKQLEKLFICIFQEWKRAFKLEFVSRFIAMVDRSLHMGTISVIYHTTQQVGQLTPIRQLSQITQQLELEGEGCQLLLMRQGVV